MSIETTLARIGAIRQAVSDPSTLIASRGALTGGVQAPSSMASGTGGESSFAAALDQATSTSATSPAGASSAAMLTSAPGSAYTSLSLSVGYATRPLQGIEGLAGVAPAATQSGGLGSRIVAIAESQLGQSEQPPGSNESPAIAQYRTATAGAEPGAPWCAYFASWAANQAGEPLGPQGQGLGSVSEIWSWAQSSGRAVANGPGVVPKPGDLIVFGGEHVGIVRGVLPNGQIATIEGNYENKVSANVRSAGEATGYVSMS
ncbi:MAG: CHAP domain-containing protein [Solirubrobacteraceae bacterium]